MGLYVCINGKRCSHGGRGSTVTNACRRRCRRRYHYHRRPSLLPWPLPLFYRCRRRCRCRHCRCRCHCRRCLLLLLLRLLLLTCLAASFTYPSSWSLNGTSSRPLRNFCATELVFAPLGPVCPTVTERPAILQILTSLSGARGEPLVCTTTEAERWIQNNIKMC